jgi:hypothetical protein
LGGERIRRQRPLAQERERGPDSLEKANIRYPKVFLSRSPGSGTVNLAKLKAVGPGARHFSGQRLKYLQGNQEEHEKQNEVSGPYGTATFANDHLDAKYREIVPDDPLMSRLELLKRKKVSSLLGQRIAQLPLGSKKVLAMYYYENLRISELPLASICPYHCWFAPE